MKVLQLMPTHLSFGTNAQLKADTLAKGLAYFKQLEKLSIGYGVAKGNFLSNFSIEIVQHKILVSPQMKNSRECSGHLQIWMS